MRHRGAVLGVIMLAAVVMATAATAGCTARSAGNPASSPAPGDCQVKYVVRTQPTGFTTDVTVTNTGTG
ncbi:MAG TPA: hypothetical protein VGP31_13650, partial [Planosporangium sp.]|nr:hypothetical protein [Planosporangium sp.]